jgi:hypothetical protein
LMGRKLGWRDGARICAGLSFVEAEAREWNPRNAAGDRESQFRAVRIQTLLPYCSCSDFNSL